MSSRSAERVSAAIFLLLLASVSVRLQEPVAFSGKVVGVAAGDSIVVLDPANSEKTVRIAGTDAPEAGQAFATDAKEFLASLLQDKPVTVVGVKGTDGNSVTAQVFIEGRDVGYSLIWSGYAWYRTASEAELKPETRKTYKEAERFARFAKQNIWSEPKPIAPWKFKGQKTEPPTARKKATIQLVSKPL